MERLTKPELRALLESIKECYPVCDRQTFKQRVLSRLAKIVPTEIISHNAVNPRRELKARAIYPHVAHRDPDRRLLLREERPTKVKLESFKPCSLSSREAQVLEWVSQGKTNKEIGVILEVSPRTVQKHLEHIYQKMGVESRTGAAAKAFEIASTASKQTAKL
jgi:DNA-binding CsgD family transcriptional regulator